MTRHFPALVVGGGISGLVCSYALQKAGIEVLLVEASPRTGGVINSVTRDGYLLELGPQSFSCTAQLRGLCADLGIADQLLEAPAKAPRYVLVNGALQPVPMSPPALFLSPLINASTKWALARDIFGKSTPTDSDESIAAFIRRKFSDQLLDRLVGPFVSGVYAGDPEKLSIRSAFPSLYEAEKDAGSVVRGVLKVSKTKKGPRERSTLNTFREGNETLVRALTKKLGSVVLTQLRAKKIYRQNDGSFALSLEGRTAAEPVQAKSIIFATPTDVTGTLLSQLDPSFESLLTLVEYAAVAVVSLGYRKSDVGHSLDGFGFLVPRSAGLRILGTVWNSSLFPGRAPDGHTLLTTFVGGATDPSAAKLQREELSSLVHREIAPLLSIKNVPAFSNITIWPRALPQYNLGHGDRLVSVAKNLARFPGIFLAGNYLRGPSVGSCVEQALGVAEELKKNPGH
ncbi:MAG TPA: protoporphyrinogen oxidase [Candidatus Acidoferrum sp.]|nr:protoporphyrinogen oxidase [Candidatus Acidoferrum sp.]